MKSRDGRRHNGRKAPSANRDFDAGGFSPPTRLLSASQVRAKRQWERDYYDRLWRLLATEQER